MKRTALLRRSKPIRKVSLKRARQLREYSARRIYFLREHPVCQVWLRENGWSQDIEHSHLWSRGFPAESVMTLKALLMNGAPAATEIHHRAKRRGEMLNDERNWLAVCRHNHERIEQNKSWARANGYLANF